MGFGKDIRVHSQRKPCPYPRPGGTLGQQLQLLFAFDVEEQDLGVERQVHLLGHLADAGEDDAPSRALAHRQHSLQLTARDHVEARTQLVQQLQHAQRRVCLD